MCRNRRSSVACSREDSRGAFEEARRKAREAAEAAADKRLDGIVAKADGLAREFSELKLTDEATYRQLIRIVQEATERNESIGQIAERFKALGGIGSRLAKEIAKLTPASLLDFLLRQKDDA